MVVRRRLGFRRLGARSARNVLCKVLGRDRPKLCKVASHGHWPWLEDKGQIHPPGRPKDGFVHTNPGKMYAEPYARDFFPIHIICSRRGARPAIGLRVSTCHVRGNGPEASIPVQAPWRSKMVWMSDTLAISIISSMDSEMPNVLSTAATSATCCNESHLSTSSRDVWR